MKPLICGVMCMALTVGPSVSAPMTDMDCHFFYRAATKQYISTLRTREKADIRDAKQLERLAELTPVLIHNFDGSVLEELAAYRRVRAQISKSHADYLDGVFAGCNQHTQ